jgi:tetratricopeptide (TPR) repeat protein
VPAVLRSIVETPPESPSRKWSKELGVCASPGLETGRVDGCPIDEEIETILLQALAKQPENRYPNVAALMDDVSRRLHGQPIEARREARLSILTRNLARYRAAVLLTCSGLLMITAFTIALGWMYQDARRQREQAAQDRAQAVKSQILLAEALIRLGDRELENGDEEEALGQYLAGFAIQEHLAAANLDNLDYQENLADTLLRLGDISQIRGDTTRARDYYQRFHDMMRDLAATEPQNADYQAGLIQAQARLSAIHKSSAGSRPTTTPLGPGGTP